MKLLLTAYGSKEGKDKGILEIDYNETENKISAKRVIALGGKCNAVSQTDTEIILAEELDGKNYLKFYDPNTFELKESIETAYIYNYMQVFDDYILLASFKSGVDAVYDRNKKKIIKEVVHERDGKQGGRSHYIRQLKDGRVVSVENGLNQIYLYRNKDLEIEKVLDFDAKNIRLMTFTEDEKTIFLNTEVSNELLVLDGRDFHAKQALRLTEDEHSFSGGHAISDDGRYDYVGVRGEDTLLAFENREDEVSMIEKVSCGKMPRDIFCLDSYIFVSCTNENAVEVYQLRDKHLIKINAVNVENPITFEMR
ncbi:MAG: beta-propeller fold lactonase family protein [Erysipelotrichaceae bacterium]|nr:beta-propeller fold lactonase family protein [Erysipelotrichaceae bacterium]